MQKDRKEVDSQKDFCGHEDNIPVGMMRFDNTGPINTKADTLLPEGDQNIELDVRNCKESRQQRISKRMARCRSGNFTVAR